MSAASSPLSIAVIGAGTISQSVHLTSLRRAGFDVRIVCDLSPIRAAEVAASIGARAVSDPAEAFASDVEAVLIATPGTHAKLAADAIRAGKHVLAEKPLAFTVHEVEELEALAAEHGVVTQVGYMKMFDPLLETAAAEYAALEGVRLVRITVMHPADEPQISHLRMEPAPRDADPAAIAEAVAADAARAEEALPGADASLRAYYSNVLNGSVIHELSLMRAMGIPFPDRWTAEVVTPLDGDAPATLLATGLAGETAVVLSWNWLPDYPEYDEELTVLASNGRLEFHLAKPYLVEERSRLVSRRHTGERREDTEYRAGHETGFLRQLDAFAAAIREGAPNPAGLSGAKDDIRQLQLIAQAIAAASGARIETETGR